MRHGSKFAKSTVAQATEFCASLSLPLLCTKVRRKGFSVIPFSFSLSLRLSLSLSASVVCVFIVTQDSEFNFQPRVYAKKALGIRKKTVFQWGVSSQGSKQSYLALLFFFILPLIQGHNLPMGINYLVVENTWKRSMLILVKHHNQQIFIKGSAFTGRVVPETLRDRKDNQQGWVQID